MHWCVCGVLGCNLDFVAGLFLNIVHVCAYDVYVSLLQDIIIIIIYVFILLLLLLLFKLILQATRKTQQQYYIILD